MAGATVSDRRSAHGGLPPKAGVWSARVSHSGSSRPWPTTSDKCPNLAATQRATLGSPHDCTRARGGGGVRPASGTSPLRRIEETMTELRLSTRDLVAWHLVLSGSEERDE